MKITSFTLFLLLLFVLIISIVFSKYLKQKNTEEMVNFNSSGEIGEFYYIPQYDSDANYRLMKIYDNYYFDTSNANVVVVYDVAANIATSGNLTTSGNCSGNITGTSLGGNVLNSAGCNIGGIYVLSRSSESNNVIETPIEDGVTQVKYVVSSGNVYSGNAIYTSNISSVSKPTNILQKYNFWSHITNTNVNVYDKYQLFYVAWAQKTIMYLFDKPSSSISTYKINASIYVSDSYIHTTTFTDNTLTKLKYTLTSDLHDNTFSIDNTYDLRRNIFQITPRIRFDQYNGSVVLKINDASGNIVNRVLNRYDGSIINISANTQKTEVITNHPECNMWYYPDPSLSYILFCTAQGTDTVLSVFTLKDSGGSDLKMWNSYRFSYNGLIRGDGGDPYNSIPLSSSSTDGSGNTNGNTTSSGDEIYDAWYNYWSKMLETQEYDERYLLKTQVIPPVCPSCPTCPSARSICQSCGGYNSGNSSISSSSSAQRNNDIPLSYLAYSSGKGATELVRDAGSGAAELARFAGTGVTELARDVASGTYGVAQDIGSGTKGLVGDVGRGLKSVGSGTSSLLRDTGSGAMNLLRDTGSGAMDLLRDTGSGRQYALQQQQQQYGGSSGGKKSGINNDIGRVGSYSSAPGTDMYSYYGALPPKNNGKQSEYIPVTASFHAFSK